MVTVCVCSAVPMMSYVLSAAAVTSACVTTRTCPWFAPIVTEVPFARQLPALASALTGSLPQAVAEVTVARPTTPAAYLKRVPKNSLRVMLIVIS